MPSVTDILKLTRQLYPHGRAFKMPSGSDTEKLHKALASSEIDLYNDALSLFNSILPDNTAFTADDATEWERRLGIVNLTGVSLADRKKAIKRKMAHPGNVRSRQHYLYLQGQIQAAGFDLYVHENRFPLYPSGYEVQNPYDVYSGVGWVYFQHGDGQHGDGQHGYRYPDVVINHIELERDLEFNIGSDLFNTFFIGGETIGTFADCSETRRQELRQLILRIKPVQTVAYLFLNYI